MRISLPIMLLAMLFYQTAMSPVFAAQPHLPEAGAAVNTYFNAQMRGDIAAIKSVICGQLLDKRSRLLSNPTYPSHLVDAYRGAQLTINHDRVGADGQVVVDASIVFPGGEVTLRQYFLKKAGNATNTMGSYCIYGEASK